MSSSILRCAPRIERHLYARPLSHSGLRHAYFPPPSHADGFLKVIITLVTQCAVVRNTQTLLIAVAYRHSQFFSISPNARSTSSAGLLQRSCYSGFWALLASVCCLCLFIGTALAEMVLNPLLHQPLIFRETFLGIALRKSLMLREVFFSRGSGQRLQHVLNRCSYCTFRAPKRAASQAHVVEHESLETS